MMVLVSLKNCHCCTKRVSCKKKNSEENLTEEPQTRKRIAHPKIFGSTGKFRSPVNITITSYCLDFDLEKHVSERR